MNDDDDAGKMFINSINITHFMSFLDDFDPTTTDDPIDIDPKMGKKKAAKLQAKAEKRQQREVINEIYKNTNIDTCLCI